MITFKTGDILKEDVQAIVNTVNCVGIMGRGIALQFKKAYPENFRSYAAACKRREIQPGNMFVFETGRLTNPRYIINFPTKRHWRGKSRMEDIEQGLTALVEEVRAHNIRSIAIPPLGSGLGGLDWREVRSRIEQAMQHLSEVDEIDVVVFEPAAAAPGERVNRSRDVPKMTPGRAALVGLLHKYIRGLLDPSVTLLELHKLMYFMQAAGEPLRLEFVKGPYGPYAENLRHVLNAIEGHFVSGYADGGDDPDKQLELVPGALEEAQTFLGRVVETHQRFEKVSDLVAGFESPFGLELLSTVHWVTTKEQARSLEEVEARLWDWGDRKKQFTKRQMALSLDVLTRQGWFDRQMEPNC